MLEISTPALVFPALSVLMLAYTNKFIAQSKRVRALHAEHRANPSKNLQKQIKTMSKRMKYIRNMQITALSGFSVNIISMVFIFLGLNTWALIFFGAGITFVFSSLIICIAEIYTSAQTMALLLEEDMDDFEPND